jgi:ribosomal protein S14
MLPWTAAIMIDLWEEEEEEAGRGRRQCGVSGRPTNVWRLRRFRV